MRIFTFFFLFLSFSSFGAMNYTIVNASWQEGETIIPGSEAWIDVTETGTYTSQDTLEVYIQDYSQIPIYKKLFRQRYYEFKFFTEPNEDGSKRIFFKFPEEFSEGKFRVSVDLGISQRTGVFPQSTTSILSPEEFKDGTLTFYDLFGRYIEKPTEGVYIWRRRNGDTGKVFIKEAL